jgi:hypothetical protein
MSDTQIGPEEYNNLRTVYQELCDSYRAIDDFRTKLLGLLPLATGTGIFLLLGDKIKLDAVGPHLLPIGLFGFLVTLGLFFYELYGIKKCTYLIEAGKKLEKKLSKYKFDGQFITRPFGVAGLINEPFAAGVVYPAVLAAWIYVALDFKPCLYYAKSWAIGVFIVGFAVSFFYNLFLMREDIKRSSIYQFIKKGGTN